MGLEVAFLCYPETISLQEANRYDNTFRLKPIWAVRSHSCLRMCPLTPQKVEYQSVTGFYRIPIPMEAELLWLKPGDRRIREGVQLALAL